MNNRDDFISIDTFSFSNEKSFFSDLILPICHFLVTFSKANQTLEKIKI